MALKTIQPVSLDHIATELLLLIASHLLPNELSQLILVSRHFTILSCSLQKQAASHVYQQSGNSVLHWAIKTNNIDLARQLLKNGAKVSVANRHGWRPLHYAAQYNRIDLAELLIENGADVNVINKTASKHFRTRAHGMIPLHLANSYSLATLLLKAGADYQQRNGIQQTPLSTVSSAGWGSAGAVRALLEAGSDWRWRDRSGVYPLYSAAEAGCVETVEVLLGAGADWSVRAPFSDTPKTALHVAAKQGNWEVVEFMLNKGADIESICAAEKTPLHYACEGGHRETAKLLIKRGANLETENRMGHRPLDGAIYSRSKQLVKLLVFSGAYINQEQERKIAEW